MKKRAKRLEDEDIEGEWENPGPRLDQDAARIAAMISEIKKRQRTPVVLNWRPTWLRGTLVKTASKIADALREADKVVKAAHASGDDLAIQEAELRFGLANDSVRMMNFARQRYDDTPDFTLFFHEDKLAVDLFDRDGRSEEMDALEATLKPAEQQIAAIKTALCGEHGIQYIAMGPDDELDIVDLAAKLGMTKFKKGIHKARAGGGDGFTEEETI